MNLAVEKHRAYVIQRLERIEGNVSERPVAQAALRLLNQVDHDVPLGTGDFKYLRNKVVKALCFTEIYTGVFNFLKQYQEQRLNAFA